MEYSSVRNMSCTGAEGASSLQSRHSKHKDHNYNLRFKFNTINTHIKRHTQTNTHPTFLHLWPGGGGGGKFFGPVADPP